jgi:chitinase
LISYDDSFSLKEKASYALEHGLGGVEMFDATGDTADSVLLKTVRQVFLSPSEHKNSAHGIRD